MAVRYRLPTPGIYVRLALAVSASFRAKMWDCYDQLLILLIINLLILLI